MAFEDRVISGRWKGRKLLLPDDNAVRPSKNRLRQAVFNMLGSRIEWQGMRVLDLCCGSGAWGIEAASRGAEEVVMVDVNIAIAQKNVEALKAMGIFAVQADVRVWEPGVAFEVVLADAPYSKGITEAILKKAGVFGAPGSWWAIEHSAGEDFDLAAFDDVVVREFGVGAVTVGRLR